VIIGLRVDDLKASVNDLKKRGFEFSTEIEDGTTGRFAYFEDPDGNPLYLWQSKY